MYDILSVKFSCFYVINWHKRKIVKKRATQCIIAGVKTLYILWKKKFIAPLLFTWWKENDEKKKLIICSVITRIILFWQVFFLLVKKIASTCIMCIFCHYLWLFCFGFFLFLVSFFFYIKIVDLLFQLGFHIFVFFKPFVLLL